MPLYIALEHGQEVVDAKNQHAAVRGGVDIADSLDLVMVFQPHVAIFQQALDGCDEGDLPEDVSALENLQDLAVQVRIRSARIQKILQRGG